MKKIFYLCLALFVIACAAKKPAIPTPTPSTSSAGFKPNIAATSSITADNFKSDDPNYAFADFAKGKKLYETKCNKCHDLVAINSQTIEGWNKQVPEMVEKFNKKFDDLLDERAEFLIRTYVLTELQQGRK